MDALEASSLRSQKQKPEQDPVAAAWANVYLSIIQLSDSLSDTKLVNTLAQKGVFIWGDDNHFGFEAKAEYGRDYRVLSQIDLQDASLGNVYFELGNASNETFWQQQVGLDQMPPVEITQGLLAATNLQEDFLRQQEEERLKRQRVAGWVGKRTLHPAYTTNMGN